jgi:diadenosine tetraphosphatase ApaH/serine/threonine PP2A family protein phosphatase
VRACSSQPERKVELLLKYAIVSDLHANLEALTAALSTIDEMGIEHIVCLGDIVGYNANPNECVDLIREREIPCISGNHDAVACGLEEPWGFNPIALSAALWTRENLTSDNAEWLRQLPINRTIDGFLMAHGSPTDRDCYMFSWEDVLPHMNFLEERESELCFFGHTHCPGIFSTDGAYSLDGDGVFDAGGEKPFFINPGSVGQPRDGDPRASFGTFDSEQQRYELVRLEYAVDRAAERVVRAGLPNFLAERLYVGR